MSVVRLLDGPLHLPGLDVEIGKFLADVTGVRVELHGLAIEIDGFVYVLAAISVSPASSPYRCAMAKA